MLREAIREGVFQYGQGVTKRHYDRAGLDMYESTARFAREVSGSILYHPDMRRTGKRFIELQMSGHINIMSVPGHLDQGAALVETIENHGKSIVAVILAQEYFVTFESHFEGITRQARSETHDVIRRAVSFGNRLESTKVPLMKPEEFHKYITDIVMGRSSIDY